MVITTDRSPAPFPERNMFVSDYPAVPISVREVREAVVALASDHGASGTRLDDIRLAVSEAATNVVMHAYHGLEPGLMRVMALIGDRQLLVTIEDDGRGLNAPPGTSGLGAGLRIMRQVSDQALFRERDRGGSTVQLRFDLDTERREPIQVTGVESAG
jgi:serine/threonine-protein kinase RsbW